MYQEYIFPIYTSGSINAYTPFCNRSLFIDTDLLQYIDPHYAQSDRAKVAACFNQ